MKKSFIFLSLVTALSYSILDASNPNQSLTTCQQVASFLDDDSAVMQEMNDFFTNQAATLPAFLKRSGATSAPTTSRSPLSRSESAPLFAQARRSPRDIISRQQSSPAVLQINDEQKLSLFQDLLKRGSTANIEPHNNSDLAKFLNTNFSAITGILKNTIIAGWMPTAQKAINAQNDRYTQALHIFFNDNPTHGHKPEFERALSSNDVVIQSKKLQILYQQLILKRPPSALKNSSSCSPTHSSQTPSRSQSRVNFCSSPAAARLVFCSVGDLEQSTSVGNPMFHPHFAQQATHYFSDLNPEIEKDVYQTKQNLALPLDDEQTIELVKAILAKNAFSSTFEKLKNNLEEDLAAMHNAENENFPYKFFLFKNKKTWKRPAVKDHIAHNVANSLFDDEESNALLRNLPELPTYSDASYSDNNDEWNF